jgi:hypothetical protein
MKRPYYLPTEVEICQSSLLSVFKKQILTFKRRSADRFIERPSPYRAITTFHLGYKKPIGLRCKWHKSRFVLR